MPQFSPSDLYLPFVGFLKNIQLAKSNCPSPWIFFQQSTTKQRKRYVLNMRNCKELFFSAATCLRCCGRFTEGDYQHYFLLCKVITFLAFVIQSEIQRNMISVISFNSLRVGCVFCALREGHLKVWALAQRCNSFITRLSYFVYMCSNMSKSARSLYDINASFHNLQ